MRRLASARAARELRRAAECAAGRAAGRAAALLIAVALFGLPALGSCAGRTMPVPPPEIDESSAAVAGASPATETAVLAGGCFWGVQAVFQHVKGVRQAVSGYAGGGRSTADYETVSGGASGHAESVQVTFDPTVVSYGTILRIYFSVAHDPTQLNRQGPDTGSQYRSNIFTLSPAQDRIARAYVHQLEKEHVFDSRIVTRIDPASGFYPAEDYHQDFATRHPEHPYIVYNDLPKVRALETLYPQLYRGDPALVFAADRSADSNGSHMH